MIPEIVERKTPSGRYPMVVGDVAFVLLPGNKGVSVIDANDSDFIGRYLWFSSGHRYAATSVGGKIIYMHRMLLDVPDGSEVDHINRDGLDNRRCNLVITSHRQNLRNRGSVKNRSSSFKGVSWIKRDKRWMSSISVNKTTSNIGYFHNEIDAARAFDLQAVRLGWPPYGLNFPEDYDSYKRQLEGSLRHDN